MYPLTITFTIAIIYIDWKRATCNGSRVLNYQLDFNYPNYRKLELSSSNR